MIYLFINILVVIVYNYIISYVHCTTVLFKKILNVGISVIFWNLSGYFKIYLSILICSPTKIFVQIYVPIVYTIHTYIYVYSVSTIHSINFVSAVETNNFVVIIIL